MINNIIVVSLKKGFPVIRYLVQNLIQLLIGSRAKIQTYVHLALVSILISLHWRLGLSIGKEVLCSLML